MTGLGVERTPRAAYPSPSTSSTGVSAPLPPHIQEAERRKDRRARRTTGSRWGLRVLVVGGLAGAAWLLTGAAAQAADRTDGPVGSLLGSVVDSDTITPVTGFLKAAAQPLEAERPANIVADVIDVPRRVLTRPVETIDEVVHGQSGTPVDTAAGGVDQVLREVAGPDRPTGGPANAQQRLTAKSYPAAERPHEPAVAPVQAPAVEPVTAAESPAPVAVASRTPISKALRAGTSVHHHGKARSARRAAPAPAVTVAESETATQQTPGGDGPVAPLRLHLGDVSGTTPTTGSGTPTEGGSAAFLPAAIASSTMACHPLPIASDVEVRRHDAEAPTVSPD